MANLQQKYPTVTELLYDLRNQGQISFMVPDQILRVLDPYLLEDKLYKSKNPNPNNDSRKLEQRT